MVGAASPAEIAARVVVGLIEIAERRALLVPSLSAAVVVAVDELDPDRVRPSSPTWWVDLPPWTVLDSFDRLRRAHDQLLVLEVQAGEVVQDLRGLIMLAAVSSPARPLGYTPGKALAVLMRMGLRRAEMLGDMAKAERVLRPRLSRPTSAVLRRGMREMVRQELRAQDEKVRLQELLTPATDLREAG